MLTYSIAIRTLGTSGEKFREELLSITRQTVQPERVIVYIADGYSRPNYTIGREEYIWVKKGMAAQRILPYDEISSDCILMLDDDVRLSDDGAERMLKAMAQYGADCVGVDVFFNHRMPVKAKISSILTNWVFPHYSKKWAFKIHRSGSFSYNNNPQKPFYWSQSCAGPVSMWRKDAYHQLHLNDELWLDDWGFAYGDDTVETYKLHINGFKLGVLYNTGIKHLDSGSSSSQYRKQPSRIYIRSKAQFVCWWRTCYNLSNASHLEKAYTAFSFVLKELWLLALFFLASIITFRMSIVLNYTKGIGDGWKYVHSPRFKSLRNYILT